MPVALPPSPPAIITTIPACASIYGFPFTRRQCPNAEPRMARAFMQHSWRAAAKKYGHTRASAKKYGVAQCMPTPVTRYVGTMYCWVTGRGAPGKRQGTITVWEDGSWKIVYER